MKKLVASVIVFLCVCIMAYDGYAKSISSADELLFMQQARGHFAKGELDKALEFYNKIPKSSDLWLEAVEEKAHVMGRKKDYARVIGLLETTMSPVFSGVVGPEPYFVASLTYLKTCNYSGALEVNSKFKDRFSVRITTLEDIVKKSGNTYAIRELAARLKNKPLSFETVGSLAKDLPRMIQRDRTMLALATEHKNKNVLAKIKSHMVLAAKADLKEIEDIINKLNIVEAEVIHRVHLADKSKAERAKQGEFSKGRNVLTFPHNGEVWIDELDSYQAQIEQCPETVKRASL